MPHSCKLPEGTPSFPEVKTGRNGIITVVLTLVWILVSYNAVPQSQDGNDLRENIKEAMNDVVWVLTVAAKGSVK
jgi:hypothetical protein